MVISPSWIIDLWRFPHIFFSLKYCPSEMFYVQNVLRCWYRWCQPSSKLSKFRFPFISLALFSWPWYFRKNYLLNWKRFSSMPYVQPSDSCKKGEQERSCNLRTKTDRSRMEHGFLPASQLVWFFNNDKINSRSLFQKLHLVRQKLDSFWSACFERHFWA
jgi:hypothetical protein